jgi:ribosome-binding factor A
MKPYRKERMSSMVQRIISDAIEHKLNDPRVAPLTTVSRVKLTGDLTIATVYLTVPGDDAAERRTLRAIRHAGGFLQRMLAQELQVRQCPELRFEMDEAAKRARETMRLIAENVRNLPEKPSEHESAAEDQESPGRGGHEGSDGERE